MSPTKQVAPVLPDSVRPGLRVLFVGTAAGRTSAARHAYYAHPGNRFWRTLHDAGLTDRRYEPHEFEALLALGFGFTDLAKGVAGMDHQIRREASDVDGFRRCVIALAPAIVAFTSKAAAARALGQATGRIAYGPQAVGVAGAGATWVLTSPSGAASRTWSPEPWRALAAAIRRI